MSNIEPEQPNNGGDEENTNKRDNPMFGRKKKNTADNFLKQLSEVLGVDPEDITLIGAGERPQIERGGRMHVREFTEDEIADARKDLQELERQSEEREREIEARKQAEIEANKKVNEQGIEITDVTTENYENAVVTTLGTVPINTPKFKTTAFALYDLPGEQVMEAMNSPEHIKMVAFMRLLRMAVLEPKKLEELEMLTFLELTDVLGDWMEQSTKDAISRQHHPNRQGPGF